AFGKFVGRYNDRLAHRRGTVPRRLGRGQVRADVRGFPEPANYDLFLGVAMLPVANVETFSVRTPRQPHRPEIFGRIAEEFLMPDDTPGGAFAFEADAENLALAEVGEQEVVVIFG